MGRASSSRTTASRARARAWSRRPARSSSASPPASTPARSSASRAKGMPGPSGAPAGDLYVEIDVEEDPRFERDGADLVTRVHVSFTDAALGAEVRVPSLGEALDDPPDTTVSCSNPRGHAVGLGLHDQGAGRSRGSTAAGAARSSPSSRSTCRPRSRERARSLLDGARTELKHEQRNPARHGQPARSKPPLARQRRRAHWHRCRGCATSNARSG